MVYKAQDIRLRRMVALKFLSKLRGHDPQVIHRFEREARAVSAVNHPNICTLYDVGEYGKRPFLVLELLDGETLQKRIQRGALTLDEILDLGTQLADALDSAHGRNIIHRDIKPANIFLTRRGQAKILDFGVAKLQRGGERELLSRPTAVESVQTARTTAVELTDSGHIVGTIAYMSPEQALGEGLDARADLFSLGAVLYEAATGKPAFSGGTLAMLFDSLLHRNPLPINEFAPRLPDTICTVIFRALEKNRERRYPNALALLTALKNLKQNIRFNPQNSIRPVDSHLDVSQHFADSIAVLPFENVSGDGSAEYLSEGIAESIINSLSKLRSLRVIPRTTAFRYKTLDMDVIEAGRKLGVRVILNGTVRERAGRLVIGAELIDCTKGSLLWGERYDRSFADIFTTESEMAEEIANKLRLRLSVHERQQLTKQPTDNVDAYRLCLKGIHHVSKWSQEGFRKGLEFLHQALEVEPIYPLAHSGLGYVYLLLGHFGIVPARESFPKAKSAALRALDIEADHANAHLILGMAALAFDWDWEQFQTHVRSAMTLAPNHANCHWALGQGLLARGRYQDAIAALKQAVQLDPLSAPISMVMGHAYDFAGQYDEALKQYRATIELDPLFVPAYHTLPIVYARLNLYQEAFATVQHVLDQSQLHDDRTPITRALLYAMSGQEDEARNQMSQLEKTNRYPCLLRFVSAAVYANLDQIEQALDVLEQCYVERLPSLTFLAGQPELKNLHHHPRFVDLVHRIGLASTSSSA
jgi:non-specific serine/threonine protein kinase